MESGRGGSKRKAGKVCGLTPIYFGLQILEGVRGELLDYRQCASEEQCVTIVGKVFA